MGIYAVVGPHIKNFFVVGLKNNALSDYRRDSLGFIFQFYNLVPNLTVRENIRVCEYLTDDPMDIDELLDVPCDNRTRIVATPPANPCKIRGCGGGAMEIILP